MTETVRPVGLLSDEDINKSLDLMLTEYNGALPMFIQGVKDRDFFTVLLSAGFFAELLAKIELVNEAIPYIEDEAVAEKARNTVTRFEEILKELEDVVRAENAAIASEKAGSENTGNDSDSDHGVYVIEL